MRISVYLYEDIQNGPAGICLPSKLEPYKLIFYRLRSTLFYTGCLCLYKVITLRIMGVYACPEYASSPCSDGDVTH